MKIAPRRSLFLAATLAFAVLVKGLPLALAQEMDHHQQSQPSTRLTIHGLAGKSVDLSPEKFGALPHKTVSVFNSHTKSNEEYSGVALSELLSKVDTPQGESVKGMLFMIGVIAQGTDKYRVLYALAEVDPSIHTGDVIVADSINGKRLGTDGAFKLVSTEEKRPARWVRNLTDISVVEVKQ